MLTHVRPIGLVLLCIATVALAANVAGAEEAAAEAAAATAEAPEEAPPTAESVLADANVLWTCLAAFLVFFMQAGFALVECGLTRAKNACNILMKNLMDFSIGSLAFWLIGFGIMFGASAAGGWDGWFGTTGFAFDAERDAAAVGQSASFGWAFLLFQTVFCATAATIVSGAMAERTKFVSYLIYSAVISILIYPIFGKWAWGGLWADKGWLQNLGENGFLDFAGSTVVHSVGGWCALAGAMVIGPRLGKYGKDGKVHPIPGHSIPMAALGVFILWLGWFGFNPGSTTAIKDGSFAYLCVTTNLAACAGAFGALITSWLKFKKPDTSFAFNGALAGLVAITAGCDILPAHYAALTGFLAGVIVVYSVVFFDRVKIDDPVGAISVHLVCGAFGTLAIGLFHKEAGLFLGGGLEQLKVQAIGVGVAGLWAFPCALVLFSILKATVGLRVSAEEELEGLDLHEHGMHAYPPALIAAENTGIMSGPHGAATPALGTKAAPASASV